MKHRIIRWIYMLLTDWLTEEASNWIKDFQSSFLSYINWNEAKDLLLKNALSLIVVAAAVADH